METPRSFEYVQTKGGYGWREGDTCPVVDPPITSSLREADGSLAILCQPLMDMSDIRIHRLGCVYYEATAAQDYGTAARLYAERTGCWPPHSVV